MLLVDRLPNYPKRNLRSVVGKPRASSSPFRSNRRSIDGKQLRAYV
jgi:hypothetical protein